MNPQQNGMGNPNNPTNQKENYSDIGSEEIQSIDWRKYIFLILNNWYWFLLTLFISLGTGYLINRYTLPKYQVKAVLLIEDDKNSSDIFDEFRSVRYFRNRAQMANEIAKLNSFSLHRRTIDSLGWSLLWTAHGRVAAIIPMYDENKSPFSIEIDSSSSTWYLNKDFEIDLINEATIHLELKNKIDTNIVVNEWVNLDGWKFKISLVRDAGFASYSFIFFDPNTLARRFRSKLEIEADEDLGTVITITSTGQIPDMEIDYINKLCENYIAIGLERKRLIAENTIDFIDEQISIIRDSLNQSERQLLSFRLANNIVDLSREGEMAYQKLSRFYEQKVNLVFERNYYNYLDDYIRSNSSADAIVTPTLVDANDPLLLEQVSELQSLYQEKEKLEFSAEKNNPGLEIIELQIRATREKLIQIIEGLKKNNELALRQIEAEERLIESQLRNLPRSEQELLNIRRKHEVINQFYTFLLEKQAEAGINKASTISNIRILDRADSFNVTKIGTKKSFIYLIALIMGIFIPVGILILTDILDTRVKELNDITRSTAIPIIGVVSHNKSGDQLPVITEPGSAFSESFRHIRTNLDFLLKSSGDKAIMVTSTISGEGKSFIALNLASVLALSNKSVLLCGMDLRRPTLHKVFFFENQSGISQILIGNKSISESIQKTSQKNLHFLPSGPIPPNPAELLDSKTMSELMTEIKNSYDFVIIDTPPLALVTDAQIISKYSDLNILVIRQNYSRKEMFSLINETNNKSISPNSLIINDIRPSRALGYYYGYGYSYGYGYGYHSEYGKDYFKYE
jgi:capsular exopolysaccharide synthesis family protein